MKERTCLILELPEIEYRMAWELQTQLVEARKNDRLDTDLFILLEHPSVFTLGRRGGLENLSVSEDFLKQNGIQVIHVERGGNITYHGPGQLVLYPIIDLQRAGLSVAEFVSFLEEVMIRTAANWGISAKRNPLNRGVWVGGNKLGSVGIALRRWISFHGLALNVNLSLEPFDWINPCGMEGIGVTSVEKELNRKIPMDTARRVLREAVEEIFHINLVTTDLKKLPVQIDPAEVEPVKKKDINLNNSI
jgi:lipoate-protein ligase B